jgi:hypothetical protein
MCEIYFSEGTLGGRHVGIQIGRVRECLTLPFTESNARIGFEDQGA